jgi:hypothetical protein
MDGEDKLLARFAKLMDDQTHEPTKKEVSAVVTKYYAQQKKNKKTDAGAGADEQKAKRAPTAYNIFFKEQMAILKETEANMAKEDCMTAKAKMAYVADLWKTKKGGDDKFVEAPEDPHESSDDEPAAPEPEPVPVAKTNASKPAAAVPPKNDTKSKFGGKPGGGGGKAAGGGGAKGGM